MMKKDVGKKIVKILENANGQLPPYTYKGHPVYDVRRILKAQASNVLWVTLHNVIGLKNNAY